MTDEERTIIENYIADELLPDDIAGMNGYNKPDDIADQVISDIEEDSISEHRVPIRVGQIIWDHQDEFIRMVKTAYYEGSIKDPVIVPERKELMAITRKEFDEWFKNYESKISEKIVETASTGIGMAYIVLRNEDHDTEVLLNTDKFFNAVESAYPTLTVEHGQTIIRKDGSDERVAAIEIRWDDED